MFKRPNLFGHFWGKPRATWIDFLAFDNPTQIQDKMFQWVPLFLIFVYRISKTLAFLWMAVKWSGESSMATLESTLSLVSLKILSKTYITYTQPPKRRASRVSRVSENHAFFSSFLMVRTYAVFVEGFPPEFLLAEGFRRIPGLLKTQPKKTF